MIRGLAAALLLLGCTDDSRPGFCADWIGRSDGERDELLRDRLRNDGNEEPGYTPPHIQYVGCVTTFVTDRSDAISAACRSYGDLEAAVTLGRLVAHGMDACAELRHAPLH